VPPDLRTRMPTEESPEFYIGRVVPDDQQFDAWTSQPLLDSIEQGGINWPSSCRNGNCRTCIGQLQSGSVRYEIEWPGLSAEEKAEGYVLPCVAYPCSDLVLRNGF
jgi:ferredoxin